MSICLLSINGCVTSALTKAKTEAQTAGFQSQFIQSGDFNLFAYVKNGDANANKMIVYIEGDGYAWRRKNRLSEDPTPRNPISLKLATRHPEAIVVYLARPCQYLDDVQLKECASIYWSSHRYSREVVASINTAITKIKSQTTATRIELIGFSGGGVIAMLVASQRDDVSRVVTVAANIDHKSWSEWHGVAPLDGSLTPVNFLAGLKGIKQLHLWGEHDKIVPYKTQTAFIESSEKNKLFKYKIIPGFTHDCCWVDQWRELLRP